MAPSPSASSSRTGSCRSSPTGASASGSEPWLSRSRGYSWGDTPDFHDARAPYLVEQQPASSPRGQRLRARRARVLVLLLDQALRGSSWGSSGPARRGQVDQLQDPAAG